MITRYNCESERMPYETEPSAVMNEYDTGEWVAYADYEKLEAQNAAMKAGIQAMVDDGHPNGSGWWIDGETFKALAALEQNP